MSLIMGGILRKTLGFPLLQSDLFTSVWNEKSTENGGSLCHFFYVYVSEAFIAGLPKGEYPMALYRALADNMHFSFIIQSALTLRIICITNDEDVFIKTTVICDGFNHPFDIWSAKVNQSMTKFLRRDFTEYLIVFSRFITRPGL